MAEQSLKQRTVSGMIWVGIQKFGTLIITFISNIILARLLTPDDYGMIGMLAIFIAISNSFIDGGFGSALIQKTRPTETDYSTVFYWNIFLSIVLYGLLCVSAPFIESFYHDIVGLAEILRIQGIVLIINAITIVQFNKLRKAMNFKLLAWINVLGALISMLVAIVMALLNFGVWSLVIQQIVFSLVNCIVLWVKCKWIPRREFSFVSLRELFKFGSYMMGSTLVNTIGNNVNGLIIGRWFSAGTLGYFTQAKKLEDVSSVGLLTVVEQVTYPMLVEVKDDYHRMAIVLSKFNSALLGLTMPLLYGLILMASPIIVFLFSAKWLPSAPILQILAVHGIFICMQGANYNAIAAIGKSNTLFRWTMIKRCGGILLMVGMMVLWGFSGLLWGIVLTGLLIALINMYLVQKFIKFPFIDQIKGLLPVILITTMPFIIIYIIDYFLQNNIINSDNMNFSMDILMGFSYLLIVLCLLWYYPNKEINDLKITIIGLFKKRQSSRT
ncbi:MAG: lipopolysaccharide biosynthesis protein [Bacteroides sp.]|nr:lipopolysaccharide biosynthesis protein [Bacteroides sp.]